LWVEDPEIRELLRTRRQTMDLFVDPSPPAGLLVQPGVEVERLARRCRSLGVELVVGGEVYRTRSISPSKGSGPRRLDSSGTLPSLRAARSPSSTRNTARSSSSSRMTAVQPPTDPIIVDDDSKTGAGE
jgi:hypothetical protein